MANTIPRDELVQLYETQDWPDARIGLEYGVSAATVRRWRRQYQILSRPRGPITKGRSKILDSQVLEAVRQSYSFGAVCRFLGVCEAGNGYQSMRDRIVRLGADTSHFRKRVSVLGPKGSSKPLDQYLIENATFKLFSSKKAELIHQGLLHETCASCGLGPEWQGRKLTLQLDHVNGIRNDHRLENLRLLCPNCHSQTKTFAGRNRSKGP